MTSVTALPQDPPRGLPRGRPLTRADLDEMPDDGHRYELFDGTMLVTPAPSASHQGAVLELAVLLRAALPADLKVVVAPFDVVLDASTVLQPDVLVASRAAITPNDLPAAPVLAVEVLSPSTRRFDLLSKRDRYRASGCPSYWVVDPDEPSIVAWELDGDEYVEVGRASGEAELHLHRPADVTVVPSDLVR